MKLKDVPLEYKIYNLRVSSGKTYLVSGTQLSAILESDTKVIALTEDEGINRAHITDWNLNFEETRDNVTKNKSKLLEEGQ